MRDRYERYERYERRHERYKEYGYMGCISICVGAMKDNDEYWTTVAHSFDL